MTRVSAVLAVRNGEAILRRSVESLLQQTFADLEVILVDDGSTDATARLIREFAERDPRVRSITIEPSGLTRALSRGCSEAQGELITRLDAGDIALPARVATQLRMLDDEPQAVLATCAARAVSPKGTMLYESRPARDLHQLLLRAAADEIRSLPAHSTAMFRRDAYERAGGYRSEFYFAQDLDLWVRMAQLGTVATTDEVLVELLIDPGSLTSRHRPAQERLTSALVAFRDAAPGERAAILAEAAAVRPTVRSAAANGAGWYFLAQVIPDRSSKEREAYLVAALRENRFHWKAWLNLLLLRLRRLAS